MSGRTGKLFLPTAYALPCRFAKRRRQETRLGWLTSGGIFSNNLTLNHGGMIFQNNFLSIADESWLCDEWCDTAPVWLHYFFSVEASDKTNKTWNSIIFNNSPRFDTDQMVDLCQSDHDWTLVAFRGVTNIRRRCWNQTCGLKGPC